MSLFEQILQDNVTALRNKDAEKRRVLSFVVAGLKAKAKSDLTETLDDASTISVLQSYLKRADESSVRATGEALASIQFEVEVLKSYLPAQPTPEEIDKVVTDVISELGATSIKDMGKVMGASKPKLLGSDSALVAAVIKSKLQ